MTGASRAREESPEALQFGRRILGFHFPARRELFLCGLDRAGSEAQCPLEARKKPSVLDQSRSRGAGRRYRRPRRAVVAHFWATAADLIVSRCPAARCAKPPPAALPWPWRPGKVVVVAFCQLVPPKARLATRIPGRGVSSILKGPIRQSLCSTCPAALYCLLPLRAVVLLRCTIWFSHFGCR